VVFNIICGEVTCIEICDLQWVGTNVIGRRHHRRHRHHRPHRRRTLTLASTITITITEASIDAGDVTRLSLGAAKVRQDLLGHSFCRDGCIKMRLRDAFENGRARLLVYGTMGPANTCCGWAGGRRRNVVCHIIAVEECSNKNLTTIMY